MMPMDALTHVQLWTDGACSGNPGPGGWAAILVVNTTSGPAFKELAGGERQTTNNRMELLGVIEGLRTLDRRCAVAVHCDSNYVIHAFEKNWLAGWKRRGWRKGDGKPVLNADLWRELEAQVARHHVTWVKVKGHANVTLNERCDELAVAACKQHGGSGRRRQ